MRVRVTKEFEDSTVAKILELWKMPAAKRQRLRILLSKFARYYTPIVVVAAVILAVIPPLVLGGGWADWIERACSFLVISCPCALVISVPLGFSEGSAPHRGSVSLLRANYLEALAKMETIVFDKTGTLTKGEFTVTGIYPKGVAEGRMLETALWPKVIWNIRLPMW